MRKQVDGDKIYVETVADLKAFTTSVNSERFL
jgi:hypothetical protein